MGHTLNIYFLWFIVETTTNWMVNMLNPDTYECHSFLFWFWCTTGVTVASCCPALEPLLWAAQSACWPLSISPRLTNTICYMDIHILSLSLSLTHTHTHLGSHLSSLVKATDSYIQAFTCSLSQGSTGRWNDVGTVHRPSRSSSLNSLSRYRRYKGTSIYLQSTSWTTSINLDTGKWLSPSTQVW